MVILLTFFLQLIRDLKNWRVEKIYMIIILITTMILSITIEKNFSLYHILTQSRTNLKLAEKNNFKIVYILINNLNRFIKLGKDI